MSTRIIFLNLCLAMLCASQAKAQIIVSDGTKIQNDTIGEAQLLVQYETRCIINPEKPENVTEETMMLEVGKNLSKFYSYTKYVCDSVLAVDFANKASQETINEHLKQYGQSKLGERTFKGYPSGKVTTLDEVAGMTRLRKSIHSGRYWQKTIVSSPTFAAKPNVNSKAGHGRHGLLQKYPSAKVPGSFADYLD